MYKSPIRLTFDSTLNDIVKESEDFIVKAVQNMDVKIDKDELLKLLKGDRDQYDIGYLYGCKETLDWIDDIITDKTLAIIDELRKKARNESEHG